MRSKVCWIIDQRRKWCWAMRRTTTKIYDVYVTYQINQNVQSVCSMPFCWVTHHPSIPHCEFFFWNDVIFYGLVKTRCWLVPTKLHLKSVLVVADKTPVIYFREENDKGKWNKWIVAMSWAFLVRGRNCYSQSQQTQVSHILLIKAWASFLYA